jgi:hypothetical protein
MSELQKPLGPDRQMSFIEAAQYYALRLTPLLPVRDLVARVLAGKVGKPRGQQISQGQSDVCKALVSQGWASLPPLLSAEQVDQVVECLRGEPMTSPSGKSFHMAEPPSDVDVGSYSVESILRCPHLLDLMNRPDVLAIATDNLGCRPTISGLRIDWSRPTTRGAADVQMFHRDYDDWKQVKLFVHRCRQ